MTIKAFALLSLWRALFIVRTGGRDFAGRIAKSPDLLRRTRRRAPNIKRRRRFGRPFAPNIRLRQIQSGMGHLAQWHLMRQSAVISDNE